MSIYCNNKPKKLKQINWYFDQNETLFNVYNASKLFKKFR